MSDAVFVSNITFGEDVIVVNYGEERKQSRAAGLMESLSIDADAVQDEYQELQALAAELIDKGLLLIRNPPKRVRPGRKLLRSLEDAVNDSEEYDDDEEEFDDDLT